MVFLSSYKNIFRVETHSLSIHIRKIMDPSHWCVCFFPIMEVNFLINAVKPIHIRYSLQHYIACSVSNFFTSTCHLNYIIFYKFLMTFFYIMITVAARSPSSMSRWCRGVLQSSLAGRDTTPSDSWMKTCKNIPRLELLIGILRYSSQWRKMKRATAAGALSLVTKCV